MMSKHPNVVLLDVSIPMPGEERDCHQEFIDSRIPGARFLNLKQCLDKDTKNAYMLPTAEIFKQCVESLGVTNSSKVVVYDANQKKGMFSSPRAWWMFRVFGHEDIAILDGGLRNWMKQGYEINSGESTTVTKSQYSPVYQSALVRTRSDIETNINQKSFELVDARSMGRFTGKAPEPRPDIKPGHIPNSHCMFWVEFLIDGMYKSAEELAEVYKQSDIDVNTEHSATCGSGITACFVVLSSYILGNRTVPVYDGAWMDWYQNAPNELKIDIPIDQ